MDWKIFNAIYEGTYSGEPINYEDGCVNIVNSKLMWKTRSESTRDRWIDEHCAPPHIFEFKFKSADGYECCGYYDELGYAYSTGRPMSVADVCGIDKRSIKYC